MAKRNDSVFDDGRPLSENEKLHVIFLSLATINIVLIAVFPTLEVFWYHFIGFVCFLGAAISVFRLLMQKQKPTDKNWLLFLFAIYVFCCFSAIVFMLVGVNALEAILNFLATFQ